MMKCCPDRKYRWIRVILSGFLLFLLVGVPLQGFCETYQDALGRRVVLDSAPRRIIPLAPSLTEILYALGLGDRVAGVTRYSYFPPEALKKPRVGSYIDLNVERILSLSPDLVIGTADGNKPGVVDLLEQARIPVYIVNPRTVMDMIRTIDRLGALCGVP